jgi:hypothetical protein
MNKKTATATAGAPILHMRLMIVGMGALALIIAGPLLLVWKQAYITSSSQRIEAMADTLSLLDKKIAALRLQCSYLSSNERIEKYARTTLHLDHPSSDRWAILYLDGTDTVVSAAGAPLIAAATVPSPKGGRP